MARWAVPAGAIPADLADYDADRWEQDGADGEDRYLDALIAAVGENAANDHAAKVTVARLRARLQPDEAGRNRLPSRP